MIVIPLLRPSQKCPACYAGPFHSTGSSDSFQARWGEDEQSENWSQFSSVRWSPVALSVEGGNFLKNCGAVETDHFDDSHYGKSLKAEKGSSEQRRATFSEIQIKKLDSEKVLVIKCTRFPAGFKTRRTLDKFF